jgi:hypothetical protein
MVKYKRKKRGSAQTDPQKATSGELENTADAEFTGIIVE